MANPLSVALDFGGTKTDVALVDRDGRIIGQQRLLTLAEQGGQQTINRAVTAIHDLLGQSGTGGDILAVAIATPGVVYQGKMYLSPLIPGWSDIDLRAEFARELQMDNVVIWNDVRAAALAELRWGQLRDCDPGLYVNLGTGISSAITIGGKVVLGAHNSSGEIAYTGFATGLFQAPNPVRDIAPLESLIGGRALEDRASMLLGESITMEHLFLRTDAVSRQIVSEAMGILGTTLANLCVLLDPERIVIGGGMVKGFDTYVDQLNYHLKAAVPFPPHIMPADFDDQSSLHGAVALAMDHMPGADSDVQLEEAP